MRLIFYLQVSWNKPVFLHQLYVDYQGSHRTFLAEHPRSHLQHRGEQRQHQLIPGRARHRWSVAPRHQAAAER